MFVSISEEGCFEIFEYGNYCTRSQEQKGSENLSMQINKTIIFLRLLAIEVETNRVGIFPRDQSVV